MKRVGRKNFTIALNLQPAWVVGIGVLLFLCVLLWYQSKETMVVKPMVIGGTKISSYISTNALTDYTKPDGLKTDYWKTDRWHDMRGWWGGYWWGSEVFFWKGREWGLGRSAYPWYWEYDKVAKELSLAALAQEGKWTQVESAILNKISGIEQEIKTTANKATIRKLQRTIDRLEYYLFNAKIYQRTPARF